MKQVFVCLLLLGVIVCSSSRCKKSSDNAVTPPPVVPPPVTPATNDIDFWLTKNDQSVLLQKQTTVLSFVTTTNSNTNIDVDTTVTYQTVQGFGYTLTGGSAQLINAMPTADKTALLQELFGNASNSIGISFLRLSIGASDLNSTVFSYDDMPAGQTDPTLANFTLVADKEAGTGLIPLLKQILAHQPQYKNYCCAMEPASMDERQWQFKRWRPVNNIL